MTKRTCSVCYSVIADDARECPACGGAPADTAKSSKRIWWIVGIGGGCFVGVILIGLLATLVVPRVLQGLHHAYRGKVFSDLLAIESALDECALHNGGRYPDSLEALIVPDENGASFLRQASLPRDPWQREYLYDPPGPGDPGPRIYTLGKDGALGGTGEDEDLSNLTFRSLK